MGVFSIWLKRKIEEMGISQRQLAYSAGIDPSYITFLIKQKKIPSIEVLAKLAQALNVSVCYVLALEGHIIEPSRVLPGFDFKWDDELFLAENREEIDALLIGYLKKRPWEKFVSEVEKTALFGLDKIPSLFKFHLTEIEPNKVNSRLIYNLSLLDNDNLSAATACAPSPLLFHLCAALNISVDLLCFFLGRIPNIVLQKLPISVKRTINNFREAFSFAKKVDRASLTPKTVKELPDEIADYYIKHYLRDNARRFWGVFYDYLAKLELLNAVDLSPVLISESHSTAYDNYPFVIEKIDGDIVRVVLNLREKAYFKNIKEITALCSECVVPKSKKK